MSRFLRALGLLCALAACAAPQKSPEGQREVDVAGWEGFFPLAAIDDAWLIARGVPIRASAIDSVASRVVKLVLADGEREADAAELDRMFAAYCTSPAVRAWNADRCGALEARRCEGAKCSYEHFGNCSGVVIEGGRVLTAAHCTDRLMAEAALRARSRVIALGVGGAPGRMYPVGDVRAGKDDFDHHWVALGEADPLDVAVIDAGVAGIAPPATAEVPPQGEAIFIVGFPRVERRSAEARRANGYELSHGVPTVSFGRVADRNEADLPFCNIDGNQENWQLRSPCPEGQVAFEGTETWKGVILRSPFLATYDSSNGYSGGPVFNVRGELAGINATLQSRVDPQERFSPDTRQVATPIRRALSRLGL